MAEELLYHMIEPQNDPLFQLNRRLNGETAVPPPTDPLTRSSRTRTGPCLL